jgi:phasin family protein
MAKKPEMMTSATSAQKAAMDAFTEAAAASGKGFEKLQAEIMAYAKSSTEAFTEATKSIFGAKSLEAAMEAQKSYAKTAFETHIAEMTKLTQLFSESIKSAIEPMTAQAKTFAESFQFKAA